MTAIVSAFFAGVMFAFMVDSLIERKITLAIFFGILAVFNATNAVLTTKGFI